MHVKIRDTFKSKKNSFLIIRFQKNCKIQPHLFIDSFNIFIKLL